MRARIEAAAAWPSYISRAANEAQVYRARSTGASSTIHPTAIAQTGALRRALAACCITSDIHRPVWGDHHRSPPERRLFLSVTARLVRQVAIEIAPAGERFEACEISVAELGTWLAQLDTIDPTTAKIIDLYCFAGASLKETAAVIGIPTQTVTGALRATLATLKSRANRAKAVAAEME